MFSAPTVYRSGSRTIEVLPGESHSDAWRYITAGGPAPASYPCSTHGGAGRVRVRAHASRRRGPHRRRAAIPVP